jgi:hypothetical protein
MSMSAIGGPNGIVAVRELRELHPLPGREGKGAVHVYANMRCEVLPIQDAKDE